MVRFDADKVKLGQGTIEPSTVAYKDELLRSGLVVNENLTPSVHEILETVCKRLQMSTKSVTAFIFADPNYQASCVSMGPEKCLLQFSSALVNSLDAEELSFVIGHEIGHFLLDHRGLSGNDLAPESFLLNRAQEISADRIGLIGANDVNAALRALIKTISGLENRLLRFDVGQFLSQIQAIENPSAGESVTSTHPSILIRARAIIWFSSITNLSDYPHGLTDKHIQSVNEKVQVDLDKYVDSSLNNQIRSIKADIAMWLSALKVLDDGAIDPDERDKFSDLFGKDMLLKLSAFLDQNGIDDALSLAQNNLSESRRLLEKILPGTFQEDYLKITKKVENFFSEHPFSE